MPRKKIQQDPHMSVFHLNPQPVTDPAALERERTVRNQIWVTENIIIWGTDNALPLRQLKAIDESPTATSCLGTVENFIKGARFSEDDLMTLVVNKDGETLWDIHSKFAQYMAQLEGFSAQFTYNNGRKITNAYVIGTESCRFVNPAEGSKDITKIKYNPYFGTGEYKQDYTVEYDIFNLETVSEGFKKGVIYNGQVYFYGKVRPLYRFYPVPKYWSGKEWIYVDGQIQTFHKENLDNGFFQSVWMQIVGNPNAPSNNPAYQTTETSTVDGLKRKRTTMTQAQEFDERMAAMFSGAKKAGTAFVSWVPTKNDVINLQAFPVNSNFDVLSGTLTDAIRGITIATEVPAILANLPQQASSLGSDGDSIRAAIDLMQSRVTDRQQILENFYNNILLPNLENNKKKSLKVKIVNFIPVTMPVTVEDKFWEVAPVADKIKFINENVPGLEITEEKEVPLAPQINPETGEEIPAPKPNEALKSLTLRDWDRVAGIKRRFQAGKMSQAEVEGALLSYGFTKQEIDEWLKSNTTTE